MVSLKINGIDFTKFVQVDSYSVYQESIIEEWEDADIHFHEGEYRKRIVGDFELAFIKESDYNDFINNMTIATDGRLTTLQVYVGGLVNDMVESKFFCTVKSSSKRDISLDYAVNKLSVQIKEQ